MKLGIPARKLVLVAFSIVRLSGYASAQDADSQDSLGNVARQTRAQHASAAGQSGKAQALVDEMQQEHEAAENAPVGFTNYDAGDYRLNVPYPYSIEGRENGGVVLLGSQLGITNTEVMAGTPIPYPAGAREIDLLNMVRQLASQGGQSPFCSAIKEGTHLAFRCNWNSNPRLLGKEVVGSIVYVVGSSSLYPVMCVTADDQHLCLGYDANSRGFYPCNNRYGSSDDVRRIQKAMMARDADARETWQACDRIIYPSIQLKEDIVVHPATIAETKAPKAAAAGEEAIAPAEGESQSQSLAELARQTRQAAHGQAQAKLDNAEGQNMAPAGYQSFALQYCQNPQHCSEARVVIPEKAEIVSQTNGQHIFKVVLNGDPVMLYAGPADVNAPYRSMSDVDYIRMRDLANSNGWSREPTDGASTQELTIDGHPALMTRFRYQRDQKTWWVGERALIDVGLYAYTGQSPKFLVGCTAPERRFAEAEALCTTLVDSLRLQ